MLLAFILVISRVCTGPPFPKNKMYCGTRLREVIAMIFSLSDDKNCRHSFGAMIVKLAEMPIINLNTNF